MQGLREGPKQSDWFLWAILCSSTGLEGAKIAKLFKQERRTVEA